MRLTTFTDYCLRVLIYAGLKDGELATIDEIAERYAIKRNHLVKVVFRLGQLGYLETIRGKGGGVRLAKDPAEVNLATLVRQTEDNLTIVECFREEGGACVIAPACVLSKALREALEAFFATLERYTLADLLTPSRSLRRLLRPVA